MTQARAATRMDAARVTGASRGLNVMDRANTLSPTIWAKAKPRTAPRIPPKPPRIMASPINSATRLLLEAPSAFRRPISRRRSAITAIMVVATQIIINSNTTTVTR